MSSPTVSLTHFSDPHCPWAYSASPAHAVLRWRFGAQLDWRLVLIGLSESPDRYVKSGYTPTRSAQGFRTFGRRFGMPFGGQPRERVTGTGTACRLVVAARLRHGADAEFAVFRALQLAQFTTTLLLDDPEDLVAVLEQRPIAGIDAAALVAAIGDDDVEAAYQADRAESRTAAGTPTEAQGREANTDGAVRYTAPSIIFRTTEGASLEVGGFQPVEAYDTALANLDVSLTRRPAAEDPVDVLNALPYAPVTREVAACMTTNLGELDEEAAERALIEAAAAGRVRREAVGTSALWHLV
ncbi:DsbA family protein [Baekduia sp. Peel2402]|uniref:DsbA family protein n=1 Tax=Baekduia sp. Peel2402 TaxID=3458296 RepID=UPI00403E464B